MCAMRPLIALAALALLQTPAAPAKAPVFVDGLAQPVFVGQEVLRHSVWIEIPGLDTDHDGLVDRIRVQINRPAVTDHGMKLPIVLIASPYSGGTLPYPRHDITGELYVPGLTKPTASSVPSASSGSSVSLAKPYNGAEPPIGAIKSGGYESYFLPRGFIFAYANSLGTGHSTGCPSIGARDENLAIKAAIDWFNGKGKGFDETGAPVQATWTTGATTMIGTSYDGTLPIGAATLGVDGLKAIVPIAGVSSYYDHRRSYGLVINSNPQVGTDADTLFDNILSRKYPEACAAARERIARDKDRETGDYNAWWHERNYVKDVTPRMRTAVLISHGLNDFNVKPRHAARFWAALQANTVPSKIWWNQGGHGDRANSARQAVWRDTLNRFWSHYLFGQDNGWEKTATVVVERENNVWVDYPTWPVPGATKTTLKLTPGANGAAGMLGLDRATGSSAPQVIVDDSSIDANELVAAAASPNRLIYQTAPLTAPVHMSGIPEVSLQLSFDKPAAIVSAMVVDYRATGAPFIVTRGWADPQNRESIERTTPVVPGQSYTISFELQPHDYIFAAGSRIGIVVLSSDRLFTLRPPPGTRLTLDAGRSSVTLPIVGGATDWRTSIR
jgi:X-Pro dipeptidyl-peptidase